MSSDLDGTTRRDAIAIAEQTQRWEIALEQVSVPFLAGGYQRSLLIRSGWFLLLLIWITTILLTFSCEAVLPTYERFYDEFAAEHLPAGVTNPSGPITNDETGNDIGWLVQILPFIEQQNAFDQFDPKTSIYSDENLPLRELSIPTFLCPSFPHEITEDGYGMTNFAACYHDVESPIDEDNHGLMYLNSSVRYSEIRDGSSHTILVAEMIPTENSLGWPSGTEASLRNSGSLDGAAQLLSLPRMEFGSQETGGLASAHPGGAHATFADGAVRFLMWSIDPITLQNLGHRSDGVVIQE